MSVPEIAQGVGIDKAHAHTLASKLTKAGVTERFELPSGGNGLRVVEAKRNEESEKAARPKRFRGRGSAGGTAAAKREVPQEGTAEQEPEAAAS